MSSSQEIQQALALIKSFDPKKCMQHKFKSHNDAVLKVREIMEKYVNKSKTIRKYFLLSHKQLGTSTPVDNSCIIVFSDTKDSNGELRILGNLEQRPNGFAVWGNQGGKIDALETSWQAALREFKEETGKDFMYTPSEMFNGFLSFEFAKFTLNNTRFYCWYTNGHGNVDIKLNDVAKRVKGVPPPVLLKNGKLHQEVLYVDWIRESAFIDALSYSTTNKKFIKKCIDIKPKDANGQLLKFNGISVDQFRLRGCLYDDFSPILGNDTA